MLTRRSFLARLGAGAAAVGAIGAAAWSEPRVRIGVCTRDIENAAKYGFDYIEPGAGDIAAMSVEQFREFRDRVLQSPLRCEAFNSFIRRKDLRVVGDKVPADALREYMEGCLERCRTLGASVVVWGSAGSRNVPDGFSRKRAQQQIAEFLHDSGEIGRKLQMVIAIEPLRRQESNVLNTGAETLEMVRRVNHPNIRMIIDYFHLRQENEDPRILQSARHEIVHLHFANPHGRLWPRDLSEDDEYAAFFRLVNKTGFVGGISIEGRGTFDHDGDATRVFLRRALAYGQT